MKRERSKIKLSLFKERHDLETGSNLIFESAEFFLNEIQKIDDQLSLMDGEDETLKNHLLHQLNILYRRIQLEALEHDKLNRKLKQLYLRLHSSKPPPP
jgi:hypothetical protein